MQFLPTQIKAIGMTLFACGLCATPFDEATAQSVPVSDTIVVDTTASTQPPYSNDSATLTSSAGSVEIVADAFKASGKAGFVKLKVTRKSTQLNGYVQITGGLQCGEIQLPINLTRIRPGITRPWEGEITCTNTDSPVVFLGAVILSPN